MWGSSSGRRRRCRALPGWVVLLPRSTSDSSGSPIGGALVTGIGTIPPDAWQVQWMYMCGALGSAPALRP